MKLNYSVKYTDAQVIAEAKHYIQHKTSFDRAARDLRIPHSTFSWHMLHRLAGIDADLHRQVYEQVRRNLATNCKGIVGTMIKAKTYTLIIDGHAFNIVFPGSKDELINELFEVFNLYEHKYEVR